MGPLSLRIQKLAGFLALLALTSAAGELRPLPREMHELVESGVRLVYQERFAEAQEVFGRITKKYPDHPAGYFFQAAATDAVMQFYGTDRLEKPFFEFCDKAVRVGELYLRSHADDLWTQFFVGGANGFKGTYEARYERWISAFRNGYEGVSIFQKIAEKSPGFADVGMGIGTYDYWRSRLTKTLWWMPGVTDHREDGIQKLRNSMERGVYTREGSANALMWILIEEKRFAEALVVTERMLALYPKCRIFLWAQGEALYHLGRYKEAEDVFTYILDTVEGDAEDNHYNGIYARHFLAKIYFARKVYYKALAECRRIQRYPLDPKIKTRHAKFLKANEDLLGQVQKLAQR